MRNTGLILTIFSLLLVSCNQKQQAPEKTFFRVSGYDIIAPNGEKFFIKGTNLGNWLNPEGYMFKFGTKINSAGRMNQAMCEMVGPDFMSEFWKTFKDVYVTKEDILYLKSTGCNTLRLPFHYKLFTDEDYMGLTVAQDGFERIDSLVSWCKEAKISIILDMHDAPGGQTGDNIDDSYGYPWLYESEVFQQKFLDIWTKIANRYKDEPIILGYDLLNEPIPPHFPNMDELNTKLEPLYKRAVTAIRTVDKNHIIMLGGAQWNTKFFGIFSTDASFDDNVMYTCHLYGSEPTAETIHEYIAFRDSVNRPMYMGETGHNTNEWISSLCKVMKENNIGWTFWPYKIMDNTAFVNIKEPENWDIVTKFVGTPHGSYTEIREARPDQATARKALTDYLENCKFKNCMVNKSYIQALGLIP